MVVVLCSLVLTHVSFVRNFDSITSLVSDRMPGIIVTENNGVTLSKSRMEGTRVRNQICTQRSPFSGCPNGTIQKRCTSQLNVRHIVS
jgi:hypothetical protein